MRSTRRLGAAGAVALSLVLAGCTGDGDPDPTSSTKSPGTATSTGTATPTETVALPVLPDEAKVETDQGATAFVRHWFALVNYGYRTGDTAPIQELSMSECTACADYVSLIRNLTQDGSRAEDDPIVVETVNSPPPTNGVVVVRVTYSQPVIEILPGPDGSAPTVTPVPTTALETAVVWEGGAWSVLQLGAL